MAVYPTLETQAAIPQSIADSGARVVDQITGVGFGVTILLLVVLASISANYCQFKRNNSLVDQILNIVPNATASVLQAIGEFKQAIRELKE